MFYSGVIEGFYGRPWSAAQRVEMLNWVKQADMKLFAYAPKDDIKIRARWRELYDCWENRSLANLASEAKARNVTLMGAVSPCLDIRHCDPGETVVLKRKLQQLDDIGMRCFALLFDDVPSVLGPEDRKTFSTFAEAQAQVVNEMQEFVKGLGPDRRLFFCPTEYCGRMAGGDVRKSAYLGEIGERLAP
ncbi:MAG TPA: beta-N-acetylglucosaminidase domain-containing protein, partial [Nordella sp.]|nr:beta-N-acetylglucosaminidase domain-containing protein [Nordella sp.]